MNVLRSPSKAVTPRMGRLARLPLFFGLEGKAAVVAGGGAAAAWKAELLSAAGARVHVLAQDCGEEMQALAADPPGGPVALTQRAWQPADLSGAAIAIGAFDDDTDAARFAASARAQGIPVNVVDKPAYCDFSFGSIVNRSPLVIGISTDGAAPVFAQAIRAKLEAFIPQGFANWAKAAHAWRKAVQASGLSFAARRRFWHLFTARAVANVNDAPGASAFDALLAASRREAAEAERGSVTLVGAGPGDPELLTLRAVRALQSADVILIDDLVAPAILDFARREAKKMIVGKTGGGPSCKQDEINALMIALAHSGKRVVRLKGGDPMIFGRAGEEIAACRAAGIAVEVVPGISAAQGAASRLGISLTDRRHARRLQYVAGHSARGQLPDDLDWRALADPAATTVIYMPKKTLAEFCARVAAEGLPPGSPAIAVANATRPEEIVIATTISELPARLAQAELNGPVLVIVGAVAAERVRSNAQADATLRAAVMASCSR